MGLASEIERLRKLGSCVDRDCVDRFEGALSRIAACRDPDSIVALADFFDDNCRFDELMFSIIHTIEIFDDRTYCQKLLEVAPSMLSRAPRWASIVFMRLLNSEAARRALVVQLTGAPAPTKSAVRGLMENINERDPAFLVKTASVLAASL